MGPQRVRWLSNWTTATTLYPSNYLSYNWKSIPFTSFIQYPSPIPFLWSPQIWSPFFCEFVCFWNIIDLQHYANSRVQHSDSIFLYVSKWSMVWIFSRVCIARITLPQWLHSDSIHGVDQFDLISLLLMDTVVDLKLFYFAIKSVA